MHGPNQKNTTFGLGVATEETLTPIRRTVHNCNQRKMDTLACHKDADELALPMLGYNQSRPKNHSPRAAVAPDEGANDGLPHVIIHNPFAHPARAPDPLLNDLINTHLEISHARLLCATAWSLDSSLLFVTQQHRNRTLLARMANQEGAPRSREQRYRHGVPAANKGRTPAPKRVAEKHWNGEKINDFLLGDLCDVARATVSYCCMYAYATNKIFVRWKPL